MSYFFFVGFTLSGQVQIVVEGVSGDAQQRIHPVAGLGNGEYALGIQLGNKLDLFLLAQ